jgi:hypothetical protein
VPVQVLDNETAIIVRPDLKKDHGDDFPPIPDNDGPRPSSCDWDHTVCTETPTHRIVWNWGCEATIYCGRHYALSLVEFVMNHENETTCDEPPFEHILKYGKIGDEKTAATAPENFETISDDDGQKYWLDDETGMVTYLTRFNNSDNPDAPELIYNRGTFSYLSVLSVAKRIKDTIDFFIELEDDGDYTDPGEPGYEELARRFETAEPDIDYISPWGQKQLIDWAHDQAELRDSRHN